MEKELKYDPYCRQRFEKGDVSLNNMVWNVMRCSELACGGTNHEPEYPVGSWKRCMDFVKNGFEEKNEGGSNGTGAGQQRKD